VLQDTRNEEYVKTVLGCAVPIVSPDRELIACLGVSLPVARISSVEFDRFILPLQKLPLSYRKRFSRSKTIAEALSGSNVAPPDSLLLADLFGKSVVTDRGAACL
jgi:hypothetical protein